MSNETYPGIPEPEQNLASLTKTVKMLKEAVELLTGQRFAQSKLGLPNVVRDIHKQTGTALSRVQTVENITSTSAETATTALVRANAATAQGRMSLKAVSAPTGVEARFSVELSTTADGTTDTTGMYLDLLPDGTGQVVFDVDTFKIGSVTDNVYPFTVSGSVVTMQDVTILGELIEVNGVSRQSVSTGIITNSTLAHSVTIRDGATYLVVVNFGPYDNTGLYSSFLSGGSTRSHIFSVDGVTQDTIKNFDVCVGSAFLGGSSYAFFFLPNNITRSYVLTKSGGTSVVNFLLDLTEPFKYAASITVTELFR